MRTFKTADVRLAAAIEKTDALDMWRKRFATLVIVRAERIVTRALMLVRTDWEVELADADGWSVTLDTLWVFDAIDVEELRGELVRRGWSEHACEPDRVRRLLRFLLAPELAAAQDRLATAVANAPCREVRLGR